MREMKKLGELGDVFIGLTYKPEDVVDEDGTIVLRSSNIQDGKLDFGDIVRVSCNVRDKLWVKENDILMCSRNGSAKLVGKTALISNLQEDMTFGAFMTIIRTPYNGYLQYFFKSPMFRRQLNSSATTTINQITRSMLDNIDVPVFDNDTADNIKAILGKCEKIIQERKVEINALDDLIKARFVEMFGEYYKNHINEKQLDEICDFIDYRGKTPEKSESGIPLITAKNVKDNRFSIEPQEFIPEENYDDVMTRGIPRVNDVLFTTEAPLGNVCRIPDVYERFCVGQRLITMQPHTDVINPEYLEHALTSAEFQEKMWQKSSGSTVKGIRSKLLVLLTIPVPPIELQNQFREFLNQVDKSKVAVQKALDETQLLFDSLMQQYFG